VEHVVKSPHRRWPTPDHPELCGCHAADGETQAQRCTTDISTSGGTSGSGPTPLLSALSARQSWGGDLSEDWDASDDELNLGSAQSPADAPGSHQRVARVEPAKWPPPARRLGAGLNSSPCVPPGALPEWHPVEVETPSDDDRLWSSSSSSANASPTPRVRVMSSSSASEACSRRRPTAQTFTVSSALVPSGTLCDGFGNSVFESASTVDYNSGNYQHGILPKQEHLLISAFQNHKHRHRRLPGRRRWGKEPPLHIMEACSEAPEASEETGIRPTRQDGAARLAGAAAAGMAAASAEKVSAAGRPRHSASSAWQSQDEELADQTVGAALARIFAPLFGFRPAPDNEVARAERSGNASGAVMGARLTAYWCEADILSPTDDEHVWDQHTGEPTNRE